jgi:lipid-A-disaccharide synthase
MEAPDESAMAPKLTPAAKQLHVFVVATEESGDRLGASLMRALKECTNSRIGFSGLGGEAMAAEGLVSLFAVDELSIVGFKSIPARLPTILRRIRQTAQAAIATRPDVFVIIDSPDFTHRVARRVRAADASIPIINYVSPSVWAWRARRARAMRQYVDHVLALLPFEPAVHERLGGPPCSYVGHPLIERARELRPDAEDALRRNSAPPVLLVLPGSRRGEIRRMLEMFEQTVEAVAKDCGPLEVVIPTVPHLYDTLRQATVRSAIRPTIIVDAAEKNAAFRRARAALTKSGTVTLELAVAAIPMVAAYKLSALEGWVVLRLIRVPSVILANLVLGENIVPEFIQGACTTDALAKALRPLLADTPERRRQLEAFSRLDRIMDIAAAAPAMRAAEIVLSHARDRASIPVRDAISHSGG